MPTANCCRPDDANWTGAEITSCCRPASLLDVPLVQAAHNVVLVAVTGGDKIEGLRQWAAGRRLSANRAAVYARGEQTDGRFGGSRESRVVLVNRLPLLNHPRRHNRLAGFGSPSHRHSILRNDHDVFPLSFRLPKPHGISFDTPHR